MYVVDIATNKASFLLAKNRIINKQLKCKTIPSLELQGIVLVVETLLDTYSEQSGSTCVVPIQIVELQLFSDSLVCINWIVSYSARIDKMNKNSVFVKNRLDTIMSLCEKHPVEFAFCAGKQNPADYITRPVSYRRLLASSYLNCDSPSRDDSNSRIPRVTVHNPMLSINVSDISVSPQLQFDNKFEPLFDIDRISSFDRVVLIHKYVLVFVDKLKARLKVRNPEKYDHLTSVSHSSLHEMAFTQAVMRDQRLQ